MTTERIKEIQSETAYPESVSVQQALLKVWNECDGAYPPDFKHIEREWYTDTHHHWIENFRDEESGEIIQIERKASFRPCRTGG